MFTTYIWLCWSAQQRSRPTCVTWHLAIADLLESLLVGFAVIVDLGLCGWVELDVADLTQCVAPLFSLPLGSVERRRQGAPWWLLIRYRTLILGVTARLAVHLHSQSRGEPPPLQLGVWQSWWAERTFHTCDGMRGQDEYRGMDNTVNRMKGQQRFSR